MKKHFAAVLALSAGLLSAGTAQANDALLGAVLGGGLGAVVGNHVGGRDGTVIGGAVGAVAGAIIASEDDRRPHRSRQVYYAPPPVRVYSPAPVYAPVRVHAPAQVYYAPPPVRVVRAPVVYVPAHPARKHWRQEYRHYERDRGWR